MNTSPPVVSGVAQVGQTLSASPGSWSGTAPISYAYQWQRCSPGVYDIAGATRVVHGGRAADLGATVRAVVTASNSAGSARRDSAQTAAVVAAGETTVTFSVAAAATTATSASAHRSGRLPAHGSPAAN